MRGADSKEGIWALVCSDQQSLRPLIDCFLFDKNMAQVLSDERIYAAVQKTIDNEDVPVSAIY